MAVGHAEPAQATGSAREEVRRGSAVLLFAILGLLPAGCGPPPPYHVKYSEVRFNLSPKQSEYRTVTWLDADDGQHIFGMESDRRSWTIADFQHDKFVQHGAMEAHRNSIEERVQFYLDCGDVRVFSTYSLPSYRLCDISVQVWTEDAKVQFKVREGEVAIPCSYPELLEALGEPAEVQSINGTMTKNR